MGGDAVEVVGREQDREAARVQVVEQVQDLVAQARVDAGGRLVHEQQLGLAEQRAGDEDALLLAARQLADVAVAEVLDVQPREDLADGGALGARSATAAGGRRRAP